MTCWLAILLVVCLADETPAALLERVLDAQRAHLSTIRTFSCQYERKQEPLASPDAPAMSFSARYWRRGEQIRVLGERDGRPLNELYLSDRILFQNLEQVASRSVLFGMVTPRVMESIIAPWVDMMVEFRGPKGNDFPLWEYVAAENGPARLISASRQGSLIVLELQTKESKRTLTADLERHGHIVEAFTPLPKSKIGLASTTAKIKQFAEYQPGKFFPTHLVIEASWVDGRAPTLLVDATISDLRINAELSDEVFTLPYPPGTKVRDFVASKGYIVDDGGRWVLDPTVRIAPDRGQLETPTATAQAKATSVPTPRGPSTSEPWPWSYWLITVCGLVALSGLGFLLWRRRQG